MYDEVTFLPAFRNLDASWKAATLVLLLMAIYSMPQANAWLGSWEMLVQNAGISSMHTAVTNYGNVVLLDHTNIGPSNISLAGGFCRNAPYDKVLIHDCTAHSVLLTPRTKLVRPLTILTDTWCSSAQFLADGTLEQTGGGYEGIRKVRKFKPCHSSENCDWFETDQQLQSDRWYATNQVLPDGRQIIVGGTLGFTLEFLPPLNGEGLVFLKLLNDTNDSENDNYYPYVHLLPDGNLYIFANRDSIIYNYKDNRVVKKFDKIPGNPRNYPSAGSSVMLPIRHSDGYSSVEVLVCGGSQFGAFYWKPGQRDCSTTCGRLKVTDQNAAWVMETMPIARCMGDMLLLPDQNVLIINGAQKASVDLYWKLTTAMMLHTPGSQGWLGASDPAFSPVLYKTYNSQSRFVTLQATTVPRMYHSTANLLPDGRILVAGSNCHQNYSFHQSNSPMDFPTELSVEAFSPPYSSAGASPSILWAPTSLTYGQQFWISFWDPTQNVMADKVEAVLTNAPFVTHSYAQGQRLLVLKQTWLNGTSPNGGGIQRRVSVTAPPTSAVAPAAYYMLWVVKNGMPSNAAWVRVGNS